MDPWFRESMIKEEKEKKMFKRPYTCIFSVTGGETSACIISAPDSSEEALAAAKNALPGASVIHAMIPGVHAGHTFTYSEKSRTVSYENESPWPDNLPPGF